MSARAPRYLLTRPRVDSERLAKALAEKGVAAAIHPMIEIAFDAHAPLDLAGVAALLITSANGARALARLTERRDLLALAVGPASADALRRKGFSRIATAGGDVAALARLAAGLVKPEAGTLLHISGAEVAGDLGARLTAQGFRYRRHVAYAAHPAERLAPEIAEELKTGAFDGVAFFSPRTAAAFVKLVQDDSLASACARLRAMCLSAAVARAASQIRWDAVRIARRPDQEALIDLILAERIR